MFSCLVADVANGLGLHYIVTQGLGNLSFFCLLALGPPPLLLFFHYRSGCFVWRDSFSLSGFCFWLDLCLFLLSMDLLNV